MKRSFTRVLYLSLALSLLVILLIFIWSLPDECCEFKAISWQAVAIAVGLTGCTFLCGGWRLVLLHHDLNQTGTKHQKVLNLREGIQAHILGLFSAAITPSGTGHVPMVALSLNHAGVPHTRAWSMAVYTSILDLFSFAWLLPVALIILIFGDTSSFPLQRFGTASKVGILLLSIALFVLGYLFNHHIHKIENAVRWLCRHSFLRRWYKKIMRFSQAMCQRINQLSKQSLGRHLYIQCVNSMMHVAGFCILWVLLWGVQVQLPFFETVSLTFLVLLLSFVIPTPGGSGYLEGSASLLVGNPQSMVFVLTAVVLWRFLTHYVNILLGFLLGGKDLLGYLQRDTTSQRNHTLEQNTSNTARS